MGVVVALVASAGLCAKACADDSEPPGDASGPARFEFWSGAQAFTHAWSLYSGATAAFGGIQDDGVRLRVVGGYGAYSYSGPRAAGLTSEIVKFHGTARFTDLLVGYHKQLGPLTVKVFAGLMEADHRLNPDDPETTIRGDGFGGKVALETWWSISDRAWSSIDASWGSLHDTYAGRARLGWRFVPALSAGLEAGAVGNVECDIARVGGFLRYEWTGGEVSLSGGASREPHTKPVRSGHACAMLGPAGTKTASVTSWRNAMKSMLLPVDQSEQMPSALEAAWLLANMFEGTVEGVALRPAFAEIVAPDPIVAVTIPPADWNETEFCRGVRQTFDAFAAGHPAEPGRGARFRWRGGSAIEDSALGSLGRVYDVTVLSRPGSRGARMTAVEAALFDSGRPVLMAPPSPPKTMGENILIHWNASTETARVILMAIPILRKAKRVTLLSVEGHVMPGPSAKDALGYLEANGIVASEKSAVPRSGRPGEAILAEAKAQGADLLIKGAYTISRLRQMIFGGATSHILGAAELPVFFAH